MKAFLAMIVPVDPGAHPEHPIAPGGDPRPPGVPTHPIFYPPGGIWGPPGPWVTPPIANVPPFVNPNPPGFGARPEHPIYYPPVIWPGPGDPDFPAGENPPKPPLIEWKTAWSPSTGWIVVGVPTVPHPVPSAEASPPEETE